MRLVRSSISNPYAIVVATLMTLILGGVCLSRLPKDLLPIFKTPAVQILTFYPGMPAEIVEKDMTTRLERWTGQSNGIARQESKSMIGVSIVKDFFRSDIDPNTAMSQVTSFAMSDLYYLPPGTIPPMVMPFDPTAAIPLALLTVQHPEMNETQLYDIAYFNLRNMLQGISGVIAPAVYGGTLRRIYGYVDPQKLAEKNLSAMDVAEALRNSNVMIPTGNAKFGKKDYQIITNAMAEHVEDMNDFFIRAEMGVPVRIRDVGQVKDTHQIQTNIVRVNGKRQVYIPIYRQPGANTIQVVDGIKSALRSILERLPKGMKLEIAGDQSSFVRNAIRNLVEEGVAGGLLTILLVLLFLRSIRSSLVVFLSLPLSIFAAFMGLYFTDQSVNAMTLGGMALSVGILIDDSIVVLENIVRHVEAGAKPWEAALNATTEVSLPVLAATVTVVIVFLPVMFLSGIGKFLFSPLALSVLFSVAFSYLVAMTLVPCFCSRFLNEETNEKDHWFEKLVLIYERMLRFCLRRKVSVLLFTLILFFGSLSLYPRLGKELFPRADVGHLTVQLRLPTGTNVNETEQVVSKIEERLTEVIEPSVLKTLISNVGVLYDWPAAYTPNSGPQDAFLEIELSEDRKFSSFEYASKLRQFMATNFPEVETAIETGGLLTAALNEGLPAPINIQVMGNNLQTSREVARQIVDQAKSVKGAVDVRIQERLDYPQIFVDIDRKKVADLGLTVQEVVKNVVTAFNSSVNFAPSFWIDEKNGNHYFLGVQYPEEQIRDLNTLKEIPITGRRQDRIIRLREVATFKERESPSEVRHVNIRRALNVFVNVHGRDIGSVAEEIEKNIKEIKIPEGFEIKMRGEVSSMRESFKNLRFGLLLAILLVYLVLVAQFRSFVDPWIMLVSVPLGVTGVFACLWMTHTSLNIQSFIGTIFMVGIVVRNGILLIEFANKLLSQGLSQKEAMIRAGCIRLRPILMTSLATFLGMLPMGIGLGHGSEANIPLARAVLGGLSVSTFLTLLVVPILYVIFKRQHKAQTEAFPAVQTEIKTDPNKNLLVIVGIVGVLLTSISHIRAESISPRNLTIEEAFEIARKNNPHLTALQARIESAKAGIILARSSAFPRITASAMQSKGLGGSSSAIGITGLVNSPFRKDPAAGIDAAWNIYDFGRTTYKTKAAKQNLEIAQEELELTEDAILSSVSDAFFRCAEYKEIGSLLEERSTDQENLVQEVDRYVRSGIRSPVERDLAKSTLQGIQAQKSEAVAKGIVSSAELLETLGLLELEPFICRVSTQLSSLLLLDQYLSKAFENHPEVRAVKAQFEQAKANLDAARRENWPILSAVGSAGVLTDTSLVEKKTWSAGIGIRIPLFEGFKISAAEKQAVQAVEEADAKLKEIKNMVAKQVRTAYAMREGLKEKDSHLQEQVRLSEQAYQFARRRYLEKTGPLSDLRDAQSAYFQSSENEAKNRYEYYRTLERLKILIGEK